MESPLYPFMKVSGFGIERPCGSDADFCESELERALANGPGEFGTVHVRTLRTRSRFDKLPGSKALRVDRSLPS